MPVRNAVSTLHKPKNDIISFIKFMQKKVFWLDKINLLHSMNESKDFATQFLQITTPKVICAGKCLASNETFFYRNLKVTKYHFWASRPGIQGLSCSKDAGFCFKTFQALIIYLVGNLFGQYVFELFASETNLRKKHTVCCFFGS